MKEFDIEKLKRENIFKTPDGFFEDMQNKVLQETIPLKRGRIINLNWAYGAAAAVALLVGVSVVTNADPAVESQQMTQIVPVEKPATYELANIKDDLVAVKEVEENLNAVVQNNPKRKMEISENTPNKKEIVTAANPEIQVDQILASFTSAELATVGKNAEQDIYLDLYN